MGALLRQNLDISPALSAAFGLIGSVLCGWFLFQSLRTGRTAWPRSSKLNIHRDARPVAFWSLTCFYVLLFAVMSTLTLALSAIAIGLWR